jgi:hypothetical protein
MADINYTERYCAFIDILGFRGLIDELEKEKLSPVEIHRVLSAVHVRKQAIRQQEADLKSQSISDAVALSSAMNAAGLDAICTAAEELSRMLLRSGYFARGAITKGRLYHDHSMVFGPALVEAYRLETEVAKFPRIMIPRSVAGDAPGYAEEGTHWKECFDNRFIKATDGPYFLHIFRNQSRIAKKLAEGGSQPDASNDARLALLKPMRTAIQTRYDEASDNPEHFQKVDWFVRYWNAHLDCGVKGLEAIAPRPL